MTYTATMTSKGQVTIPKEIRDKMALKTGSKLILQDSKDGIRLISALTNLRSLKGSLKLPKHLKKIPLDELIEISKESYFKEKYAKEDIL